MPEFLIFRRLESKHEATAIQKILTKKNVPSVLSEERSLLDTNIIGQQFDPPFCVKIPAEHFPEAENAIRQAIDISTIEVEDDYYLLAFSNAELIEVVEKRDEWGNYDYALALQLLEERGNKLSDDDIERLNSKRVATLAIPENGLDMWAVIGYLSAALGGVGGILIGYFLMTLKKTLPDGTRVHTYSSQTQQHGLYIMLIGVISTALWNIFYFVLNMDLSNFS